MVMDLSFLLGLDVFYVLTLLGLFSFFSAFVLFPPGQMVLIVSGIFVGFYDYNFLLVFVLIVFACFIGNCLLYFFCRKHGEDVVRKFLPIRKRVFDEDLLVAKYFFRKHGDSVILIGRNLPILNGLVSILAGTVGVDRKKYFIYTLIGICTWSLFFMGVGYFLGSNYEVFMKGFG